MSYDICIWDPYAFARPQDYIPTDLAEAENIRFALDWDEDEHLTDPRPMLPENPKFAAFLADLQELSQRTLFSDLFRSKYSNCMSTVLKDACEDRYHFLVLPSHNQLIGSGEPYLALYELVQRHRLVMFDQDIWLVIRPDGSTLPPHFAQSIPHIEDELERKQLEHQAYTPQSGQLPRQLKLLDAHFSHRMHAYFLNQGCQVSPDSLGYCGEDPEYEYIRYCYDRSNSITQLNITLQLTQSYGEYKARTTFSLFVPAVEAYFKHVADTPEALGGQLITLQDSRLRSEQSIETPNDIQACLVMSQPMIDFVDQIHDFEQVFELWLKPDPFRLEEIQHPKGPYYNMYVSGNASRTLKAMILMRLINQPQKYAPIIEHLYQHALDALTPKQHRCGSGRYPNKSPYDIFLLDWATLTELLDRDYPPSTE